MDTQTTSFELQALGAGRRDTTEFIQTPPTFSQTKEIHTNKHIQTRTSKTAFGFEAADAQGKPIKTGMVTIADGRSIYTVLAGFCSVHRGATSVIRNVKTKEELKPQSPHRCR